MRFGRLALLVVLGAALGAGPASAQQRAPQQTPRTGPARQSGAADEAIALANGWALLAEGHADQAAAKAAQVRSADPQSVGGLVLALEAEIARGGARAGLGVYESWLGPRTLEEPALLRRLARALLVEESRQTQDQPARVEALRALRSGGDVQAATELDQPPAPLAHDLPARAALGDGRAVALLIDELQLTGGTNVKTIDALGSSGSPQAVAPLAERLTDPRQEIRGAVVDALGKLGGPAQVTQIAPLLSDPNLYVRLKAAAALLRLGSPAGVSLLQQAALDRAPAIRLAAADAMSVRPEASFLALVDELTTAENPEIRATAARLLAPHDPERSRAVLQALIANENPAIRELASRNMAELATNDLATLRGMMRLESALTRVRAAARVLALTR